MQLKELINDIALSHADMMKSGMEHGRAATLPYFRAIFAAYDQACADPHARLPTPLMAAIEAARERFEQ